MDLTAQLGGSFIRSHNQNHGIITSQRTNKVRDLHAVQCCTGSRSQTGHSLDYHDILRDKMDQLISAIETLADSDTEITLSIKLFSFLYIMLFLHIIEGGIFSKPCHFKISYLTCTVLCYNTLTDIVLFGCFRLVVFFSV